MRRKYRGSISVDVDIDELLGELSNDDVKAEHVARFGEEPGTNFNLLDEVRAELLRGRVHGALALIESAACSARIPDAKRLEQYELMAGRA